MSTSMRPATRALAAATLLAATALSAQDAGDALAGRWRPADDAAAVVAIACTAGTCEGVLAEHAEHPQRVGTAVLRALRWDAARQRWSGQAYAARLGRLLDAEVVAGGRDQFTLEVHTWLGTRQVVWQRVP